MCVTERAINLEVSRNPMQFIEEYQYVKITVAKIEYFLYE